MERADGSDGTRALDPDLHGPPEQGEGVNVIRIVDSAGVQWTYATAEDVPPEHLPLLSSSPVSVRMFEPPPERLSWASAERPIPQPGPHRAASPVAWIIAAAILAVAGLAAAVIILTW